MVMVTSVCGSTTQNKTTGEYMPFYYKNLKGILDDGLVEVTEERTQLHIGSVETIMQCGLPAKAIQLFIERTDTVTLGEASAALILTRMSAIRYINECDSNGQHPTGTIPVNNV